MIINGFGGQANSTTFSPSSWVAITTIQVNETQKGQYSTNGNYASHLATSDSRIFSTVDVRKYRYLYLDNNLQFYTGKRSTPNANNANSMSLQVSWGIDTMTASYGDGASGLVNTAAKHYSIPVSSTILAANTSLESYWNGTKTSFIYKTVPAGQNIDIIDNVLVKPSLYDVGLLSFTATDQYGGLNISSSSVLYLYIGYNVGKYHFYDTDETSFQRYTWTAKITGSVTLYGIPQKQIHKTKNNFQPPCENQEDNMYTDTYVYKNNLHPMTWGGGTTLS